MSSHPVGAIPAASIAATTPAAAITTAAIAAAVSGHDERRLSPVSAGSRSGFWLAIRSAAGNEEARSRQTPDNDNGDPEEQFVQVLAPSLVGCFQGIQI